MGLTAELKKAIAAVAGLLENVPVHWLIGGSCGLLLQGVNVAKAPRDIDIYVDKDSSAAVHQALQAMAVDVPEDNETTIYTSRLSHYRVPDTGVVIELVAGFQVRSGGSLYRVEVDDFLYGCSPAARVNEATVRLMPLAHELIFNLLRERPDRYEAIAESMLGPECELQLEQLRKLTEKNLLSAAHLLQMQSLLGGKLRVRGKVDEA